MKPILLIVLQFFLATAFSAAQVVPWSYANSSMTNVHKINISNANPTIDNVPLQAGDVIAVFYDSLGFLACGGYSVWPATEINTYGATSASPPNGFSTAGLGEPFKFKVWSKQRNCVADSGDFLQFQYIPPTFNDSLYFKGPMGSSKMIGLNAVNKKVYYPKTHYCAGDPDPLPVKIGSLGNLSFSSQPGLTLNPSSGLINIASSAPGTYVIYFTTDWCLSSNSFLLTIKMNLDNLQVTTTKSTCTEKGQLQVDQSSIICGTGPYQYKLRNILTGQETVYASALLPEIADATYELFVKDANNEEVKWKNSITMTKECKDLIIAPNGSSGQPVSYYIPYEGKAKIYDRFGLLKKEMSIPADWDATDNTGNQVAMGQYVIICNEDQQIVVTVIK